MAPIPRRDPHLQSPYRTAARPAASPRPALPAEVTGMVCFIWIVTVARVAMGAAHGEGPSRELAFAWLVLVVVPILLGRALARRNEEQT